MNCAKHATWARGLACALAICAFGRAGWADPPLAAQAPQTPEQAIKAMLDADTTEVRSALQSANYAIATLQKPQKEGATPPSPKLELAAEAKIELTAAAGCAKEAENLRQQASSFAASNPAYAQRLDGMALRKFEEAKQWMGRANSAMGIAPAGVQGAASQPPAAPPGNFCREACRQLKMIAGQGNDSPGLPFFDEKPPPTTVPAPSLPHTDNLFKGTPSPPARVESRGTHEVLVLPRGAQVDLSPLREAVAKIDPKAAGMPLFRSCGAGGASCPSNELLRFLADPRVAAALGTIGGVELDATFDVLSVAGFSELRGGPKIRLVEKPVLISLKALLHALAPHTRPDAWAKLPDTLRHPGSVDRINGFILDPKHQDIVLIGQTAADPANRIDVDEMVLAIRQVWRDGKIMAISLDPRPDDIGGPQYPRFIGTPPDSIVAKIMVEADYSMKAIMNDAGFAHGLGIVDLKAIMQAEEQGHRDFLARFWLSPRYLGAASIYSSASGRTTLLETGVQTRTEEMLVRNGALEGTGQHATIAERAASVLSAKYSELETAPAMQPRGIFQRLHGLVDLVTMAKIWRVRNVGSNCLDQFSSLPYRPLTGAETLPSAYPGLSSIQELDDGRVIELSGGVQLAQRQGANSARTYNDHISEDLEKAVDEQRGEAAVARVVSLPFALPAGADEVNPVENALFEGNAALRQNELDRADAAFRRAVEIAPSEPQGYAGLASVELFRGKPLRAAPLAIQAMQLAPDDNGYRLIGLDVAWRIDPTAAYAGNDEATRQELSRYYVQLASVAKAKGQLEEVERYDDWATELWEDNATAHLQRAFARDSAVAREQLMARAVRAFRHQLASGMAEARQPLAVTLVMSSCDHITRAFGNLGVATREAVTELEVAQALAFVRHGVAEARQAVEVDPNLPIAAAQSLVADALLALLTDAAENQGHGKAFIDRGTALLAKFPGNAEIHAARANVFQLSGDMSAALRELDEAIRIEPSNVRAHAVRAQFRASSGDCQGAVADADTVRRALQGQPKLAEKFGAVPESCR